MGRVNCHTHAAPVATPLRANPSRRAGAVTATPDGPHPHSAPRSSQQPTLARGCEAEPAANCSSVERRGDTRMHTTLRMVRKGEIFTAVHGETCA